MEHQVSIFEAIESLTISLVSETYGFSDYSVFYRAFVKEYGKSPKKYRDEIIRKG